MADSVVKNFKVRLPKRMLEELDKLVEEGVVSGYAEAVRRGLELFLERYAKKAVLEDPRGGGGIEA